MNEQIKQLAEQAGFTVEDGHIQSLAGKRAEKFAELIVRECVLISRTSADGFSAGRRMEEHFGVEE